MAYRLKDTMTAKRREWLETLARGSATRTSKVGCECMRLGWTEWVLDESGRPTNAEQITSAGLEALAKVGADKTGEQT